MLGVCYLFVRCYVRCLRVIKDSNVFKISKLTFTDVRCCEKASFSFLLAAYLSIMAAYFQLSSDYYSQRGNISFPVWEYFIPNVGIFYPLQGIILEAIEKKDNPYKKIIQYGR